MIRDRQMEMIEDLDERTKSIENNLKLISDEILKANKRILKMEAELKERFGESKDLGNKIRKIESAFQEIDLRIRHFETFYKKNKDVE